MSLQFRKLELALFLACFYVDDFEVFNVVDRVGSEGEAGAVRLLDSEQEVLIFMAKAIQIGRMQKDAEVDFLIDSITDTDVANDADQAPLNFDAHGTGRLD